MALLAGLVIILSWSGIFSGIHLGKAAGDNPGVRIIKVTGVIDPLMADYVIRNIDDAENEQSLAVIIVMDIPGGFDQPMRDIIKKMTGSRLPVAVYVAPPGSRAASAGTFIVMAADVAAMAPGTNLGAAHPVAFGVNPESVEDTKVTNDAAAYIRSLADASGRNANWAELAVRQSISLTVDEALAQQVVDIKAENLDDFVNQLQGFHAKAKDIDINLDDSTPVESGMTLRENILHFILNPNVAYVLLLYGLLALSYELVHPGIGFGAATGTISLLISFYALYMLPVNLTGLALIIIGVGMLAADLYITSQGALSAGGLIALLAGSFFLFDAPFLKVSWPLDIALAAVVTGFFLVVARKVMAARRLPVKSRRQAMIGEKGRTRSRLDPMGQVFVRGEIWSAEATGNGMIEIGEEIEVIDVKGLLLRVKRIL